MEFICCILAFYSIIKLPACYKTISESGWRNLTKNRASSLINVGGLAIGMAVAMLIGLWINGEFSFNRYHQNYKSIAQVMQHQNYNGEIHTDKAIPLPSNRTATYLRK